MRKYWFIMTGWNCEHYALGAVMSVLNQGVELPVHVVVIEDASTDGTRGKLFALQEDERVSVGWTNVNRGAAFCRSMAMEMALVEGAQPGDVFVLLDLDDRLSREHDVVGRLEREYALGAEATYGSYSFMDGSGSWPQEPYDVDVIMSRAYRNVPWRCWPLRTFKVKYAELANDPDRLRDHKGGWLQACTDVALMWGVLEQLPPGSLYYIPETLYLYRHSHENVTRKRQGRAYKDAALNFIRQQPRLEVLV